MGSTGNEEKFDYFGKQLARLRIYNQATESLTGLNAVDESSFRSLDGIVEDKKGKRLLGIIDALLDLESFYLQERGPANDSDFVGYYSGLVANVYLQTPRLVLEEIDGYTKGKIIPSSDLLGGDLK